MNKYLLKLFAFIAIFSFLSVFAVADYTFEQLSQDKGKPVVVYFGRSGCSGCIKIKPEFTKLKNHFGNSVSFYEVAPDPSYANKYGFSHIPTVVYFYDGKLKNKHTGFQSFDYMKRIIEQYL